MKKKLYFLYILLGLFYALVKLIYYSTSDLVGIRAVIYGIIASGLTVCAGTIAAKELREEHKSARKLVGHWLAALLPLMIISLTPLVMLHEKGSQWLKGDRLTIFVIFEVISITQVILAVLMFKGLKFKSDRSIGL